jgi:hypothetical protein
VFAPGVVTRYLNVKANGKHNYTFSAGNANSGFRLRLKGLSYGDEHEYEILEEKIVHNRISSDEVLKFQKLLNGRVLKLLSVGQGHKVGRIMH